MTPIHDYLLVLAHGLRSVARASGPRRWRRLAYLGVYVLVLPPVTLAAGIGLALDHLLYSGWRRAPLDAPVFIVGNHRTGSTFLHRLLARDSASFATTRLVDLALPSVVQKRALRTLGRIDRALGGLGARAVAWIDARWGSDFRKVHPMGLLLPEEDDFLLFFRMASAALWETFPEVDRFRRHFWSDAEMDPAELDAVLGTYRRFAQRHRHHLGQGTWLSKNPLFSGRITGLRRVFPDARFIYLVRDPRQVVPSTASLMHAALGGVGALESAEQHMAIVHEICERLYTETLARLEDLPPEQLVVVRQEDLVADLEGTIEAMLTQLGLPMSDTLRAAVTRAASRAPSRTHQYRMEDWGLTEADILERYGEVVERFGYR